MNTVTEEATNMGVNTETIGGEAPLGLLNHVVGFRSQAVAKVIQNHENTKKLEDMKESDKSEKVFKGTDTEQVSGLKDGWEYHEMEEEDVMNGEKGNTEEEVANDEKEGDTEDEKTTITTRKG